MNIRKILFIWPPGYDPVIVMPLSIASLAGNLNNQDYEIKLLDCCLNNLTTDSPEFKQYIEDYKPDLIGITSWSFNWPGTLEIIKTVKQINKNITTVLGGIHATAFTDTVIETNEIDYVFRGEAELSFPLFLAELNKNSPNFSSIKGLVYKKNDEIIRNEAEYIKDLSSLSYLDYDSINLEGYIKNGYKLDNSKKRIVPVLITRGCPYNCKFCAVSVISGKKVRKPDVKYVINLIDKLYHEHNIQGFNFVDDNFTFDVNYAKNICREIIKLNLKNVEFSSPQGVRMQKGDRELWTLMKAAGWKHIGIAPESGSERVLKLMKKDLNLDIVPGIINDIRSAGLKVHGNFVLGFPGETEADLIKTKAFIKKCSFNLVYLNNFQPYPGTPIYNELVEKEEISNGLLPKNYSDAQRPYTPEELRDFNFSKYVLSIYLYLAVKNPVNAIYMLSLFNVKMLFRKILKNFLKIF